MLFIGYSQSSYAYGEVVQRRCYQFLSNAMVGNMFCARYSVWIKLVDEMMENPKVFTTLSPTALPTLRAMTRPLPSQIRINFQ
jgi:hypothetical protein